ncbi:MAG: cysteine desulfurase, partial [Oscillospiraceae bacterium]|nr:cysteine desulfurase [Oscillospiraceae bacterium]
ATTPVDPQVAQVIADSLKNDFANPSSLYKIGAQSEYKISTARKTVADCLGAKEDEVYFTSCASESNNIAIYGLSMARKNWANRIVTTGYEHPAVRKPLENLKEMGFTVVNVNPKADGNINPQEIIDAVDSKTALVTLIHVNNETGAVLDVKSLCEKIKAKNKRTVIHIDATQSFMKLPLDVSKILCESMAFSGHKIYAPKGIGGWYLKKGTNIKTVMAGGGQEKGIRAGTENIHYILGFAKACQLLYPNIRKNLSHFAQLKTQLLEGLAQFDNVVVNSPENAAPYTVNFSFMNYRSETLLHFLEADEIYISSGSACSKGAASHTLTAMGVDAKRIDSSIRVSFGIHTTGKDIDAFITALKNAQEKLQKVKR